MPPAPPISANGPQQVVVAGVQSEPRVLDDRARLVHVGVGLLDRDDVVDLGQLGEQVRLEVDRRSGPGCCRRITGMSVAAATASKCASSPRRLGLL